MSNKPASETTREVLRALGYTPKLLAEDLEITEYKARRLLTDGKRISFDEFMGILNIMRNATPNLIMFGRKERDSYSNKE